MSTAEESTGGGKQKASSDFCYDAFDKILTGLGAVGRVLRQGFVATSTCIKKAFYPIKEVCINKYDNCAGKWEYTGTRATAPKKDVMHFTKSDSKRYEDDNGETDSDEENSGY